MLIPPKPIKSRFKPIIGKICEVCEKVAKIHRRVDTTKSVEQTRMIYTCKSCHNTLTRLLESTNKEANPKSAEQILSELTYEKQADKRDRALVEIDEPSPDSDYWTDPRNFVNDNESKE